MMVELDDLDEIRLFVLDNVMATKKKVERAYNKRIRIKSFRVGDLV